MTNHTSGAHKLIATLLGGGIDTCFANPGTSEMHFIAALDDFPAMKSYLCLFEGVATGAADGFARMRGKPAVTLLHLGPGLANGLANLHNAKKAGSPVVNVIGDHATFHKQYDAPLNSDVEATAAPYSHHVHSSASVDDISTDTADAITAAISFGGQIAALILPADVAWNTSDADIVTPLPPSRSRVDPNTIEQIAQMLGTARKTGLILGGEACYGPGLIMAGQIAKASGATLLAPYATARRQRGKGIPPITRIPFPVDAAVELLAPFDQLILLGTTEPVAFFAYPGLPSRIIPGHATLSTLTKPTEDIADALHRLCTRLGAGAVAPETSRDNLPAEPHGPLMVDSFADVVARAIRPNTILVDEGITSSRAVFGRTAASPAHDTLVNVGGSIGAGLPLALGAAVACPDRPVLCLSGDGSAGYTLQALWTMAQNRLDITVVICANHTYEILRGEMIRVGAMSDNKRANSLLDIVSPRINWVDLAHGFGVPGTRVETAEQLAVEIERGFDAPGPHLIEAQL